MQVTEAQVSKIKDVKSVYLVPSVPDHKKLENAFIPSSSPKEYILIDSMRQQINMPTVDKIASSKIPVISNVTKPIEQLLNIEPKYAIANNILSK